MVAEPVGKGKRTARAQLDEPPANRHLRSQTEAMGYLGYYRSGASPCTAWTGVATGPEPQPSAVSHNADAQPVTGA